MHKLFSLKTRLRSSLIAQILGLVLLMSLLISEVAANNLKEYQLKSAFLYNFIAFTQWPDGINQTLNLCVYGEDYFGEEIDKLQKKSVHGSNIKILRLDSLEKSKECQVLFISKSAINTLPDILTTIHEKSILTIADSPAAASEGVIINMTLSQNKINFEINLQSAHSVKLNISSKLLQLASKVYQ